MDVDTALREIDAAVRKHVDDEYEETRSAYRETLAEVDAHAGGDAVEEVTTWVASHVREHGERPSVDRVEAEAADAVRSHGGEIPADSRLAD